LSCSYRYEVVAETKIVELISTFKKSLQLLPVVDFFCSMAESYIKKTKRTENFTVLGNQIFNSNLSLESLGILCYILHLPDDWVLRKSHLMKLFNIGRDKTDRLFKELKSKGYIADVIRIKGNNGRFDGVHYLVYDTPFTENHTTENHTTGNQCGGKPTTTKNEVYKELTILNTNLQKEISKKEVCYDVNGNEVDFDFLFKKD